MMGEKTQLIRLLDVFGLGPFMIYSAMREKNKYFKTVMLVSGALTIIYNGKNYLEIERQKKIENANVE